MLRASRSAFAPPASLPTSPSRCAHRAVVHRSRYQAFARIITLPAIGVFFLAGFAIHEVPWSERVLGPRLAISWSAWLATATTTPPGVRVWAWAMASFWPSWCLFGWKAIPAIVLLASLTGILVSVPVLVLRQRRAAVAQPAAPPSNASESLPSWPAAGFVRVNSQSGSPFGPFLAASALAYLFLGKLAWAMLMRMLTGE